MTFFKNPAQKNGKSGAYTPSGYSIRTFANFFLPASDYRKFQNVKKFGTFALYTVSSIHHRTFVLCTNISYLWAPDVYNTHSVHLPTRSRTPRRTTRRVVTEHFGPPNAKEHVLLINFHDDYVIPTGFETVLDSRGTTSQNDILHAFRVADALCADRKLLESYTHTHTYNRASQHDSLNVLKQLLKTIHVYRYIYAYVHTVYYILRVRVCRSIYTYV